MSEEADLSTITQAHLDSEAVLLPSCPLAFVGCAIAVDHLSIAMSFVLIKLPIISSTC